MLKITHSVESPQRRPSVCPIRLISYLIPLFLALIPIGLASGVTDYVDPWIGSEGGGNVFVGATLPFGMVKLGPDCETHSNSGYLKGSRLLGYSHVHVSGTGGGAKYGNILVAPLVGALDLADFASPISELSARPGYFSARSDRYGIRSELTVSRKAGFHQYTFPRSSEARIIIDAGHFLNTGEIWGEAQELVGSEIKILSETEIEGHSRVRNGWNKGDAYTVYFYSRFDKPALTWGTWRGKQLEAGNRTVEDVGSQCGAYFVYETVDAEVIRLKVGISFISKERARLNMVREIPGWNFDATCDEALDTWEQQLGKVRVEGGAGDLKTIFYTALYHAALMPTNRTGENPKWQSEEPYYDDYYAIWDTFRATMPLLTILDEPRQIDLVRSLIDIYRHEGYMPDARSGNDNGRTQGGSNCDVVIADAYAKGLKQIDYETAYEAMLKNAEVPPGDNEQKEGRGGLWDFNRLGYVSTDYERAGTRTVEYGLCDWGIAQVAKGLGKYEDYEKYRARAGNWKNLWKPIIHSGSKGFIMPKDSGGEWIEYSRFDPLSSGSWGSFFYESHSWEYSLYVPQDVGELIRMCGGKSAFVRRLDTFFEGYPRDGETVRPFFNVSNEPGFLTPCLYIWAGRPDKTAFRVRRIIEDSYSTAAAGLPGNDDSGSMSAWFAFHAMGFYPNAGSDVYLISSPQFERVTIQMGNERTFVIEASGVDEEAIYVNSARLNGQPLRQAWFRHNDIKNGGTLMLEMAPQPSNWGSEKPPPSISD